MRIYVINLDRQPKRMAHMARKLAGLDVERVAAIDGATLDGPASRTGGIPTSFDELTRFERAIIASHRACWQRFMATDAAHCCVLEDDLELSPDFRAFMTEEDWIPEDCRILKLETYLHDTALTRHGVHVRGRFVRRLMGAHLGASGYILSRAGASILLRHTEHPRQPIDHIMFDAHVLENELRVHQLDPALCTQSDRLTPEDVIPFELSHRRDILATRRLSRRAKLLREIRRPFRQAATLLRACFSGRLFRTESRVVHFR